MNKYKADYYKKLAEGKVECSLCPHKCIISEAEFGLCGIRKNNHGELYTLNYGQVSSLGIDPIEKKPLYHFYPGSDIFSLGTFGCNFHCDFCQNWQISQEKPELKFLYPEEAVQMAIKKEVIGIAYTYSEPSIWFEYIRDTAKLARKHGLKNVLVTNGFINQEPLKELLALIDAANVDLKSIHNKFYQKYCGGQIEPVLDSIRLMNNNIHLEITTLLITGLNTSRDEIKELCKLLQGINPEIPLHLTRYFPAYKMDRPSTSAEKMQEAYKIAAEYLNYVYPGNIKIGDTANTYCPQCGQLLLNRKGYSVQSEIKEGKCPNCGWKIYGEF